MNDKNTTYFYYNMSQTHIYVGLGSNLGDRAGNLLSAVRALLNAGLTVTRLSRIYETEPVETFAQPRFLNMVAELRGNNLAPPEEVMARLLQVEQSLARTRDQAKGPRTLDLDLLLYGDQVCESQLLKIPHPRMHLRRFVLAPLAELVPQLVHPTLNRTISELLESLEDKSEVRHWTP